LYFISDIRRKRFFQETTQETPEGDFENLADIELTDIPDPAGLYDFSELSHSSVNLSSTSVTHQEEDCALPIELAGRPVPGQPHCIAAADNEVLSSSHQGRYTTQPLCTESQFWQGVLCFVDFLLCCSSYSKIPLNVVRCFVSGKKILKTSTETLAMTMTMEMMTLFHQKGCPKVEGRTVVPRCLQEMHYFYLILNKTS
jgi:hypothetical protein